jgi:hypothetical protein
LILLGSKKKERKIPSFTQKALPLPPKPRKLQKPTKAQRLKIAKKQNKTKQKTNKKNKEE